MLRLFLRCKCPQVLRGVGEFVFEGADIALVGDEARDPGKFGGRIELCCADDAVIFYDEACIFSRCSGAALDDFFIGRHKHIPHKTDRKTQSLPECV